MAQAGCLHCTFTSWKHLSVDHHSQPPSMLLIFGQIFGGRELGHPRQKPLVIRHGGWCRMMPEPLEARVRGTGSIHTRVSKGAEAKQRLPTCTVAHCLITAELGADGSLRVQRSSCKA